MIAVSPEDQRAIAKLACTRKQAEVWDCIEIRHMTHEATSLQLGISKAAVRDRLDGARRNVTAYIRSEFPATPIESTPAPRRDGYLGIVLAFLAERDGPNCYLCKRELSPGERVLEHVIPRAHGGTDDTYNLAIACDPCNCRKGSKYVSIRVTSGRPVYHHAPG